MLEETLTDVLFMLHSTGNFDCHLIAIQWLLSFLTLSVGILLFVRCIRVINVSSMSLCSYG
jgi:hypothetical protein